MSDLRTALAVLLRDYKAVHGIGDLEMQPALYQAQKALEAANRSKRRTVTYVCPVCAASLERQE